MGAGSIAVLFWGVPLPDDRADIAYGLIDGGHWIGVRVAEMPPLPKSMRDRVIRASEAAQEVDRGGALRVGISAVRPPR